ncbi:hypothetical protein QE152_g19130 [Popillia japonica]|uniref:Uncharacterized protein n=1 Tax=Popillia japonica TaxID=7064 RepID=A0AAW1L4B4_POPJA
MDCSQQAENSHENMHFSTETTDHTTTVATQQPPIILVKRLDHISPVPMIKKVAAARKNFRAVDEVLNSPENIINLRNRKR